MVVITLFFCSRSSERDAIERRTMILNHRVFFPSHLFITNEMGCLLLSVLRRRERGYEVSHLFVHTFAYERLLPQSQARLAKRLLAVLSTHFEHSDPYDRGTLVL
jgi:hypothetical protein